MSKLPFQLSIQCIFPENRKESLTCTALLRVIPGSRDVYEASWNDKAVITKVFSHRIKAKRHLLREWRGLNLLQERGLSSARPLFCGRSDDGRWAVVVEKILDSVTALEVFDGISEESKKSHVLQLICKEIAKQHEKGVLQKDLHLGNFLLSDEQVFALDPGGMKFFSHPISRKTGLAQLAMLACHLYDDDTTSIARLCDDYFCVRGWHLEESDEGWVQKRRSGHRKKVIRKALKKTLKKNTRFLRIQTDRFLAVFDRDFCLGTDPLDLIKQIDALMDSGDVFKRGNTCYVSRVEWNGKNVIIKRYNHKGVIHSLRHTVKKSRAYRGWLSGHRLGFLNFRTPKPVAYIEQRRGLVVWTSYLITEYLEGQTLHDYLRKNYDSKGQCSEATQQVLELLEKLGKYHISHGDMKHSNILLTDCGPALTDLDSMKRSRFNWLYRRRLARDISRFKVP